MKKTDALLFTVVSSLAMFYALSSCRTIPKGVKAVSPFDAKRYMGKWYEISRKDFMFEKNLDNTTAEYSIMDNGEIKVVNSGHNFKTGKHKQAIGKAKFVGSSNEAKLKVSFFGPFYAGYNVLALDPEYQYALVGGKNFKYLWILSRSKTIPDHIKTEYLQKAKELGYDTGDLIWVRQ